MPHESILETMLQKGCLFNAISESTPFGLFVCDTEGQCVYANTEYRKITGLTTTEIYGSGWASIIHTEDRSRVLNALYTATESSEAFSLQYRILPKDTAQMDLLLRASPIIHEEQTIGVMGAVEDITLRLKMESQLRINFAAMESSTSMIMITNAQGRISWVNPAFSHGTGYTLAEIDNKTPSFLSTTEESPINQAITYIFQSGQAWKGELQNRRKDGSIFLAEEIITPILNTEGTIGHFLAIIRDITEKRENERKLAEYSEHLEELVAKRTKELEDAQKRILLQQQLERELEIAVQIQNSLLPEQAPSVEGFLIASRAYAAHYISGDLYDFTYKDNQYLFVVMADISGKGMPAALLSASARSLIREKILCSDSPAQILDMLNISLYPDLNKTEMFITIMLARIDIRTGHCTYSNAGHTRTLHWQQKTTTINYLGATSIPLGIFPFLQAKEESIYLDPLDMLFIYSDGLTEARAPSGSLLGENALAHTVQALICQHEQPEPSSIIQDLIEYIETYTHNALPDDDRSMILISRANAPLHKIYSINTQSFVQILQLFKTAAANYSHRFASELELLITELLTNIIRHAYGLDPEQLDSIAFPEPLAENPALPRIDISYLFSSQGLILDVFDYGQAFDEQAYSAPNLVDVQAGGYGYYLMQKLADSIIYTRESDERNHWHVEKRIKESE